MPVKGMVTDSLQQAQDSIDPNKIYSSEQAKQIKEIVSSTFQQMTSQQNQDDSSALVIAVVCVLVVLGVGFYFFKRMQQEFVHLQHKVKEQEDLLSEYGGTFDRLETRLEKAETTISSLSTIRVVNQQKSEMITTKSSSTKVSTSPQKTKPVECITTMYADFYLEGSDAMVEHRDLSSSSSDGMFLIKYQEGAAKASYTVNTSKEKAILEDILIFTNFINIKDIPPSYSTIQVVSDGELVKSGACWKISKKMEVKLI